MYMHSWTMGLFSCLSQLAKPRMRRVTVLLRVVWLESNTRQPQLVPLKSLCTLATLCGGRFQRHKLWHATVCRNCGVAGAGRHPNSPYNTTSVY